MTLAKTSSKLGLAAFDREMTDEIGDTPGRRFIAERCRGGVARLGSERLNTFGIECERRLRARS
jgi:hypothetical protein